LSEAVLAALVALLLWLQHRERREWAAERRVLTEKCAGVRFSDPEPAPEVRRAFGDEAEYAIELERRRAGGFEDVP
jgi:hypothetical protein